MKRVRFVMLGGFLGAGKTTAIARLARHYVEHGQNVGIVTNDQAYNLVDTESLRAQGFKVGEVPGACFCCKFDDLVSTANTLNEENAPDIIIAEPVGSCTDLVATVVEPLRHLYGEQYEIGPLAVLLKPEHGRKILREESGVGFSPKAAYIFLKQIEEADIVVINKIDKLSEAERDELARLVNERYPEKEVLLASSRFGDGFESVIDALAKTTSQSASMDVDYDVYAEGEAELGWLNCQVHVQKRNNEKFALDDLPFHVVANLREAFAEVDGEAAHLKVLAQSGTETAIANLVETANEVELSMESGMQTDAADMIVNARVAMDPEQLEDLVTQAIRKVADESALNYEITGIQRFRPGRPVPTHRMTVRR